MEILNPTASTESTKALQTVTSMTGTLVPDAPLVTTLHYYPHAPALVQISQAEPTHCRSQVSPPFFFPVSASVHRFSSFHFIQFVSLLSLYSIAFSVSTIAYESIGTLIETFYEYITCVTRNILKFHWLYNETIMVKLEKFEISLKLWIEITRYLAQSHCVCVWRRS